MEDNRITLITITLWVNHGDEIYFYHILKVIDSLPIDNKYTWRPNDIKISKNMKSDWVCVNIPLDLYLKFIHSFKFNNGVFS